MTRAFVASAGIHVLLVGILILVGFLESPRESLVQTIDIRIGGNLTTLSSQKQRKSTELADSRRLLRRNAEYLMEEPEFASFIPGGQTKGVKVNTEVAMEMLDYPTPEPLFEPASFSGDVMDSIDPVSGMDIGVNTPPDRKETLADWSLTWAKGEQRGIVFMPVIDIHELPELTNHLIDVSVDFAVSPQGTMLSSRVEDPGSGDVRIDRYILAKTLGIVFEAWPDDEGIMEGRIRLVFQDGGL